MPAFWYRCYRIALIALVLKALSRKLTRAFRVAFFPRSCLSAKSTIPFAPVFPSSLSPFFLITIVPILRHSSKIVTVASCRFIRCERFFGISKEFARISATFQRNESDQTGNQTFWMNVKLWNLRNNSWKTRKLQTISVYFEICFANFF